MAIPEVANRTQLPTMVGSEFDKQAAQSHSDPFDVPYAQSHYLTLSQMTWTVGAGGQREFWVIERSPVEMIVSVLVDTSIVAGTVSNVLYLRLPLGKVAAHRSDTVGFCQDAGVGQAMFVTIGAGSDKIGLAKINLANWTAGGVALSFQLVVRTVAQR